MLATEIEGIAEMLRTEPGKIGLAALILDIIALRVAALEAAKPDVSAAVSTVTVYWGQPG